MNISIWFKTKCHWLHRLHNDSSTSQPNLLSSLTRHHISRDYSNGLGMVIELADAKTRKSLLVGWSPGCFVFLFFFSCLPYKWFLSPSKDWTHLTVNVSTIAITTSLRPRHEFPCRSVGVILSVLSSSNNYYLQMECYWNSYQRFKIPLVVLFLNTTLWFVVYILLEFFSLSFGQESYLENLGYSNAVFHNDLTHLIILH